jgi:hypothetical protein
VQSWRDQGRWSGSLAVGIYVAYGALAGILNTTTVRVSPIRIDVFHTPISASNRTFNVEEIRQVYTKQRVGGRNNSANYEIRVITTGGKDAKLLGGLSLSEQAMFIEQEVERFLGIPDQEV